MRGGDFANQRWRQGAVEKSGDIFTDLLTGGMQDYGSGDAIVDAQRENSVVAQSASDHQMKRAVCGENGIV